MRYKPMDFSELDKLFSYDAKTGDTRNKIDRGGSRGIIAKAGAIATSKMGNGYFQVRFRKDGRRISYLAHRVAWLLYYGVDPGDLEIDHIDQDPSNNRISNLRVVNHKDNSMNQGKSKNNTSGITGVCWHKVACKWRVYISNHGEPQYLGIFTDKFEAICARKSAENRLGYHENHGK